MADDDNTISSGSLRQPSSNNPYSIGRRFKNPLGYYSSSTYQISLYMITPDAYDAFILSGRTNINALGNTGTAAGVYLIAQSGGINNSEMQRASGFKLDYYIDNLSIKTYMNPKATMTASNSTEIKFQILEPYGFSFLTNLKRVGDELVSYNSATGAEKPRNPTRQFFIIGIRFLGYDENGNIVSSNKTVEGDLLDANASPNSTTLFDRYYDINITNIKFKIDGKATTYNVDAISIAPYVAFGLKRGRINNDTTLIGDTVYSVLNDLVEKINKVNEENAADSTTKLYNKLLPIRYLGEDADLIKGASIVVPTDLDKSRYPGIEIDNTIEVTEYYNRRANPDRTKKQIIFKNDTSIQQAITQIITQSSYLLEALSVVYDSVKQPSTSTGEYQETPGEENGNKISWYNISAEVSNPVWNTDTNDYVFDITYVIQTYKTPVIYNAYIKSLEKYYGPHKRYDYWYTGKNSEIISYEQTIDNGYFTIVLDGTPPVEDNEIPNVVGQQDDASRQGTQTTGSAAQNTVITSLYDPKSFATAKITILGDPDFLAMESPGSVNDVYDRFYGSDGFTITPNGGQVFIEIDFKEAIDYDTQKGYLSINESILFWKYPEDVPVTGVSYEVLDVMSNFQGGSFKQTLNCVINSMGGVGDSSETDSERELNTESTEITPSPALNSNPRTMYFPET
jgi:hypothetical protein